MKYLLTLLLLLIPWTVEAHDMHDTMEPFGLIAHQHSGAQLSVQDIRDMIDSALAANAQGQGVVMAPDSCLVVDTTTWCCLVGGHEKQPTPQCTWITIDTSYTEGKCDE